MLQNVTFNLSGELACRVFLGVFEGLFGTGIVYYLSLWYHRTEMGMRVFWFLGPTAIAGYVYLLYPSFQPIKTVLFTVLLAASSLSGSDTYPAIHLHGSGSFLSRLSLVSALASSCCTGCLIDRSRTRGSPVSTRKSPRLATTVRPLTELERCRSSTFSGCSVTGGCICRLQSTCQRLHCSLLYLVSCQQSSAVSFSPLINQYLDYMFNIFRLGLQESHHSQSYDSPAVRMRVRTHVSSLVVV